MRGLTVPPCKSRRVLPQFFPVFYDAAPLSRRQYAAHDIKDQPRRKHHAAQQRHEHDIQHDSDHVQSEPGAEILPHMSQPDHREHQADHNQNQLVKQRHHHENDRAVGGIVSVLAHLVELRGLPAGCGRCNARIKISDKRIPDAPRQGGVIARKPQKPPDHITFQADKKQSQKHCRKQTDGIAFSYQ